MKPDKQYDQVLDDPPISKRLLSRIEQMLPEILSVEVKYAKTESATARKIVRFDMEGGEHPEEIVGEIAQVCYAHNESSAQPPHHYEAWVKREGKSTVHLRVKIDEFGDMRDESDTSEMQVLLSAAMQFVDNAKGQNAELHTMIKDLVVELRMMAAPQKDAMAEMGKIVAASYQQMYYAFSLISQEKAAEREAELKAQQWSEGFDMVKEFLPLALRQKFGLGDDEGGSSDDAEGDGEDEDVEEEHDEDRPDPKANVKQKRKGKGGKKPTPTLWEACQGFGASLDGQQMAKMRKLLSEDEMTWLEEAISADNDVDAAVAVNKLRKALSSQKLKNKLMLVLPFGSIGLLSAILRAAEKIKVPKTTKRKARKVKAAPKEAPEGNAADAQE